MSDSQQNQIIEWAHAAFTLPGQKESGDIHVVSEFENGVLVGAIDGLGHGNEAAMAARAAKTVLEKHSHESVITLIRRAHEELKTTRGVVMSIASFNSTDDTMTWLSIGNVDGILLRANREANPTREIILLRGGVVGYQIPQPFASMYSVFPGDTLIFATDGITSNFYDGVNIQETPRALADKICSRWCKKNDDALVVVARYLGKKK